MCSILAQTSNAHFCACVEFEHNVFTFNRFMRRLSNSGIHLYSMRKHAAWMHMQSHVNAIWIVPESILYTAMSSSSLDWPNSCSLRMNSAHFSARSSGFSWWFTTCNRIIISAKCPQCFLHCSMIRDSLANNWRSVLRCWEESVAEQCAIGWVVELLDCSVFIHWLWSKSIFQFIYFLSNI